MGEEHLRARRAIERLMTRVADDANDFRLRDLSAEADSYLRADWVGAGPELTRGAPADDGHFARVRPVSAIDEPSALERNAHGAEVVPRYDRRVNQRVVARHHGGTAVNRNGRADVDVGF